MRITLQVVEGPFQGSSYSFEGHDVFLVGRSNKAHLKLRDPFFSRIHFMIEVNPPHCRVQDMGSHNGTYVNGERIESASLKDGDHIKAGHTVMRVVFTCENGDSLLTTALNVAAPQANAVTRHNIAGSGSHPALLPSVPGYDIQQVIGRGGMGVVYLARHEATGADVAIKTVVPASGGDSRQIQRFLREAQILQQLEHPNIVRFLEVGDSDGLLYFVMEYVRGTDLQMIAGKDKPLKTQLAVRIICQVLDGLGHAHAKGFVHRDIKPANILIEELPGGKKRAKVADFGLGRLYRASRLSGLTLHGDMGGTPNFMPPEQITDYRNVQPAADQYAAAALLYHLLTAKYPLDLPSMPEALVRILHDEPIPIRERLPDLPQALADAIHRALEKNPADRFADVNDFRTALMPFG